MQPFDNGGEFDKRFDEVLAPAITRAGLTPYRVDRDPSVSIPIQRIEEGIQVARICLADITLEKMNVAFELGYALAKNKPCVIVAKRDTKRWFDVQHHRIIFYASESPGDFNELSNLVTKALKARLASISTTDRLEKVVADLDGLHNHEVAALITLGGLVHSPGDTSPTSMIRNEMERLGYTHIATTMAISKLEARKFIDVQHYPSFGNDEGYLSASVEPAGWKWLHDNIEKIQLHRPPPPDKADSPDLW